MTHIPNNPHWEAEVHVAHRGQFVQRQAIKGETRFPWRKSSREVNTRSLKDRNDSWHDPLDVFGGKEKAQGTTARLVKQWDADKLGCVLETSWHSYRQTVVGSSQMLLDCPPSSNFTDSAPLFPVAASCRRRFQDERREGNAPTKEEKRRGETLVEFDSNRVKRVQTWKREPGVLFFRNSTSNLLWESGFSMIYKS